MAASPGVRSSLGPPHLPAALVPSRRRRRRRGSWCPSPMLSLSGSHVPGSVAVPALPRLAPHPMAGRRAGGRDRLWADARAAPNPPDRCVQSATRLETRSVSVAAGQRVRNRLLSRERRKATILAEQRSPASLVDFQRRQLGAGGAPVTAHRWIIILTRKPPLRGRPSPSLTDAFGLLVPEVFAGFTTYVCFCSSFRSKHVPGVPV